MRRTESAPPSRRPRPAERDKIFQPSSNSLFSPKCAADAKTSPSTCENSFWDDDGYLLFGSATAAVLANNHDGVLARIERLREVAEAAV